MKLSTRLLAIFFVATLLSATVVAQPATQSSVIVPRLVNYSGHAMDAHGKPVPGVVGITFAIYKDEEGGAPLWLETQNVQADAKGNYTVQLGATRSEGLPVELFNSDESRWLGAQVSGQEEQRRVLLLSVPYALKAADSETLGDFRLRPSCWRLPLQVFRRQRTDPAQQNLPRQFLRRQRSRGQALRISCRFGRALIPWATRSCSSPAREARPRWASTQPRLRRHLM